MPVRLNFRIALAASIVLAELDAATARGDGPLVIEALARSGDPVPGFPQFHFSGLAGYPVIDNVGNVAFQGFWSPPGSLPQNGVFYGTPEQVNLLQYTGQSPPGLPPQVGVFQNFSFRLSQSGTLAMRSEFGPNFQLGGAGFYLGAPPDSQLVMQSWLAGPPYASPAPGIPGATIGGLSSHCFS